MNPPCPAPTPAPSAAQVEHAGGGFVVSKSGLDSRLKPSFITHTEMCLLSNNITDYYFVSQGKTTIPSVDDGEEMLITDVSGDGRCCAASRRTTISVEAAKEKRSSILAYCALRC